MDRSESNNFVPSNVERMQNAAVFRHSEFDKA